MGTLAGVALGSIAFGSVFSASASYQAGETNKELAKHNAEMGEIRARDAINRGQTQAKNIREAAETIKATQRAAFATQGVDVGTGSAAIIQAETDYIAKLEVETTLNNAAMEAWGYEVGAESTRTQGELAANTGRSQALGTLLSGIGSTAVAARRL